MKDDIRVVWRAAKESVANRQSATDTAKKYNVSRKRVCDAVRLVPVLTAREEEALVEGWVALNTLLRIHNLLRVANVNSTRAEEYAAIKEPLVRLFDALTSLPNPVEVVGVVRARGGTFRRTITAKLPQAAKWMEEFSREWNSKETGNPEDNAGDGDQNAGEQSVEPSAEPATREQDC